MKTVSLQYYEDDWDPFGLTLTLPASWLGKPTRKLVAHFFKAYQAQFPGLRAPDPGLYCLVDVGSGREVGAGAVRDEVADGATLSVAPKKLAPAVSETSDDDVAALAEIDGVAPEDAPRSSSPAPPAPRPSDADVADELDQEDEFESYCVYMFDTYYKNNRFMSYVRVRKKLRTALRKRLASRSGAERDPSDGGDDDSSSSSPSEGPAVDDDDVDALAERIIDGTGNGAAEGEAPTFVGGPPREKTAPKDWGRINFCKALCPNIVAGRRCPRGDACTYAHRFDQLQIPSNAPPPHVCGLAETGGHALSAPEWWQMGVFAEPGRQQPHLWKKMSGRDAVLNEARAIRARHRAALARAREANTVRA